MLLKHFDCVARIRQGVRGHHFGRSNDGVKSVPLHYLLYQSHHGRDRTDKERRGGQIAPQGTGLVVRKWIEPHNPDICAEGPQFVPSVGPRSIEGKRYQHDLVPLREGAQQIPDPQFGSVVGRVGKPGGKKKSVHC